MKRFLIVTISAVVIILGVVGWVVGSGSHFPPPMAGGSATAPNSTTAQTLATAQTKTMRSFRSARELKAYFRKLAKKQMHRSIAAPSVMSAAPAPPPALSVDGAAQPTISTEVAAVQESVTNVQHAGVDE